MSYLERPDITAINHINRRASLELYKGFRKKGFERDQYLFLTIKNLLKRKLPKNVYQKLWIIRKKYYNNLEYVKKTKKQIALISQADSCVIGNIRKKYGKYPLREGEQDVIPPSSQ